MCVVPEQLAVDPGAWNIIWWCVALLAIGFVVNWVVTTLILRTGRSESEAGDQTAPGS